MTLLVLGVSQAYLHPSRSSNIVGHLRVPLASLDQRERRGAQLVFQKTLHNFFQNCHFFSFFFFFFYCFLSLSLFLVVSYRKAAENNIFLVAPLS